MPSVKRRKRPATGRFTVLILFGIFIWVYVIIIVLTYYASTLSGPVQNSPGATDVGRIGRACNNSPFSLQSLDDRQGWNRYDERDYVESSSNTTTVIYTQSSPPLHYPYEIIHTITTRFMIGQQNHTFLSRARYLLFKTFCYSSMVHQTRRNVFWMVVADPGLPRELIDDLRSLLNNVPSGFAYLVLSNRPEWAMDGVGVPNSTTLGVHWPVVAEEFKLGQLDVVTGNTSHLEETLRRVTDFEGTVVNSRSPRKPLLIIETLLDADDGLNNHGIEWIQDAAVRGTVVQQTMGYETNNERASELSVKEPSLDSSWWFLTGTDHIEWHNRDVWLLSQEEYDEFGVQSGLTGWRHRPFFATSAGFTRVGLSSSHDPSLKMGPEGVSQLLRFPKDAYSNHALTFYFDECNESSQNLTLAHCFRRLFDGLPFVVKSRSITSDSMENMNSRKVDDYRDVGWVNMSDIPLLLNESEYTWDVLKNDFSIHRYDAWIASVFMLEHRKEILLENKDSRCSPGFPCNKSAKKMIVQMEHYWKKQARMSHRSGKLGSAHNTNARHNHKHPKAIRKYPKSKEPLKKQQAP